MAKRYLMSEATAAFVRKLRVAAPYRGESEPARTRPRAAADEDGFPPPFTVRWSGSSEGEGGAWCVWLPNVSQLVYYAATAVSSIGGVAAAQHLPTGWYVASGLSSGATAVWLNVSVTESTGAATATISDTAGTSSTGVKVYAILLATMSTDSTTGARSVRQLVDSVITLGGSGGGTTISVGTPKVVQITTEWVGYGHADFSAHPYTLKIVRGNLTLTNGELTVVEDSSLAAYIQTTPLSEE